MTERAHFLIKHGAISGVTCGFILAVLGVPLWLLGVNEWLSASGFALGLVSLAVIAVERRRK